MFVGLIATITCLGTVILVNLICLLACAIQKKANQKKEKTDKIVNNNANTKKRQKNNQQPNLTLTQATKGNQYQIEKDGRPVFEGSFEEIVNKFYKNEKQKITIEKIMYDLKTNVEIFNSLLNK